MIYDKDELLIKGSALTQVALTRITAELGPRALHKEKYTATAETIVKEVFGDDWDVYFTLDAVGSPHVLIRDYRGPRAGT